MSNVERSDSANQRVRDVNIVEEALARAGNPVPEWRDGKVRWLTPEEIPDLPDTSGGA